MCHDQPQPEHPATESLRAAAFDAVARGDTLAALKLYDLILRRGQASAEDWGQVGNLLLRVKEFAQAIEMFRQSLRLEPNRAEFRHNLARALFTLGDADAAVAQLRITATLTEQIDPLQGLANIIPNAPNASHADVLRARSEWAAEFAKQVPTLHASRWPLYAHGDSTARVAYLSAHFSKPNYMKPVWGLINHHDRSRFQVHLLHDGSAGATFQGYRPEASDRVHETRALTDQQLADLLRELSIDILVDLSAYSYPSRLSFFLQKVAPVTAAWFNMYATSGLPAFDYLVGDVHVISPEEEPYYCERIERLPLSYLTFQVDYPVPPVSDLPCLQLGKFTFGSLVSQYKLTPPVIDTWAAILAQCADSTLLLGNADLKSPQNRDYLRGEFAKRGVEPHRIEFLPPADHDTFLRYYDRIDLALDAFPYNGGTTTMEALWQGVPVLTKRGDRWCGRTSETLLFECHLADYVASDTAGYIDRAVQVGTDRAAWPELARVRKAMREVLAKSSVCDSVRLATEMERIYDRWLLDRQTERGTQACP